MLRLIGFVEVLYIDELERELEIEFWKQETKWREKAYKKKKKVRQGKKVDKRIINKPALPIHIFTYFPPFQMYEINSKCRYTFGN